MYKSERTGTSNLSKEQIEEFKEAFAMFDVDGDEAIDINELGALMESMGYSISKQELAQHIKAVDADGNGTLDFSEFLTLMATKIKYNDTEEELI